MSIFICELKKLWNWRILLIIAAIGVLTWFAFLADALDSYDSLTKHGIYGSYQTKMFRLYGETLEPEELADFDIPGKLAEVAAAGDAVIAKEPVFAKYGITGFEEYLNWRDSESYWILIDNTVIDATAQEDTSVMNDALNGNKPDQTLDEWYASPMIRWQNLTAIERRYVDQQAYLDTYIQNDLRPAVVRAAERLSAAGNNSLVNAYLMPNFSLYAAVTGVFALAAVIVLVIPLIIIDRSRKINLLQYSSAAGRKIFRTQFAAAALSAFILSAILTAVSFLPFLSTAGEYWNASIMSLGNNGMWLYNITFGQYVFILAVMIVALNVGTACIAFILARFSANIVTVMIKAVPVGAALAAILALAANMALSYNNIVFNDVFILKILAAPFVVVLTLTVAVLSFLLCLSGGLLYLASIIVGIGGAGLVFTGNITGGVGCLVIAFLISPFGLPAVAVWITDKLDDLNYSLRDFITG